MSDIAAETRLAVLDAAHELNRKGLVEASSGNVSARVDGERVCMTPSSVLYDEMVIGDLVIVDLDGNVLEGEKGPTSEKALHLACYRAYPEVGGVIHSHAVFATMFAVARQPIPAAIEEVAVYVGGEIPVCAYTMTGTDQLGDEVAAKLADRGATLLANHGLVSVGRDVGEALKIAALVERTAQIVWGARQLGELGVVPPENNENFGDVYRMMRGI